MGYGGSYLDFILSWQSAFDTMLDIVQRYVIRVY